MSRSAGIAERWDAPCAWWSAPRSDADDPGPDHATVTSSVTPSLVRRLDGRLRGRASQGSPDTVTLMPAGERTRSACDEPVRFRHIHLPAGLLRQRPDPSRPAAPGPRDDRVFAPDRALGLLADDGLARASDPSDAPPALEMDARATLIALHVAKRHGAGPAGRPRPTLGGLAPWRMRRALDLIEANLADAAGLSRYHFLRAFKASSGLPPHATLVRMRVDRARQALVGTDLPVAGIAASVGHDDPNQPARAFRKATGLSPSRYRRERRP